MLSISLLKHYNLARIKSITTQHVIHSMREKQLTLSKETLAR
jgi:hypothetical protein